MHCKKTSSDVVNTEALIHELGDSVLYYKSQNTICEKYRSLQKDDFFLIIMNDVQKDMLINFSDDLKFFYCLFSVCFP